MIRKIFYRWFWTNLYYDIKWGISNLIRYRKIVWNTRPWDFVYVELMLKHQLENLLTSMEVSYEVKEDLNPKIADIKRAIELLDNHIKDEFIDRIGGLTPRPLFNFEKKEVDGNKMYELKETRTEEEIKRDHEVFEKANKLEDEEWKELWSIFSNGKNSRGDARGWWE